MGEAFHGRRAACAFSGADDEHAGLDLRESYAVGAGGRSGASLRPHWHGRAWWPWRAARYELPRRARPGHHAPRDLSAASPGRASRPHDDPVLLADDHGWYAPEFVPSSAQWRKHCRRRSVKRRGGGRTASREQPTWCSWTSREGHFTDLKPAALIARARAVSARGHSLHASGEEYVLQALRAGAAGLPPEGCSDGGTRAFPCSA